MPKPFLDQDFLLQTDTARHLYHDYAKSMPIIDYHCHLPPDQIAANKQFENLTQIWLYGDHYKWRGMRANGIDESYCTGNKTDYQKFEKWAETVPYTLRNPLYHWTHLELQRYFGVTEILNPKSARAIYEHCSAALQTPDFSTKNLLRKMNVKVVGTTDDPTDSLQFHQQLIADDFEIKIAPTFRPDKAMNVDNVLVFNDYVNKVEAITNSSITTLNDYLTALKQRHDFFGTLGCRLSDHGLEQIYAEDYTQHEIETIFAKIRSNKDLNQVEKGKFRSAMLVEFAHWDCEKGWTQQFHIGAIRNNNSRMMHTLGPDTGWDSIGDYGQIQSLSKFLDRLDVTNQLAKTIVYNLNPADNDAVATMLGNFQDGTVAGKMQFGSGWWFLDQKHGMESQINSLSNMGLLSRFVGMLTDSRSFMSYPRHEYFRRILCNLLGNEVEEGQLPNDIEWIGKIVQDVCYNNAKQYFGF
jgi:glucuronate isomerase